MGSQGRSSKVVYEFGWDSDDEVQAARELERLSTAVRRTLNAVAWRTRDTPRPRAATN